MTIKQMYVRAKELYPQSRRMQRTWVRQTFHLLQTGRHALLTGGWKIGNY
jgi:hypothetical protein